MYSSLDRFKQFVIVPNNLTQIRNLPVFLILAISSSLPFAIFFVSIDTWDGSLLSLDYSTGDYGISYGWLSKSASMHEQFFSFFMLSSFAHIIDLNFVLVSKSFTLVAIYLLASEVYRLSRGGFQLSKVWSLFASYFVITFPAYTLLVSSVLHYYIWCIAIGWYCARKFVTTKSRFTVSLSALFLIFSFSYGVMRVLVPCIVLCLTSIKEDSGFRESAQSIKFKMIATLSIVTYILDKLMFPTTGQYAEYNSLVLPLSPLELIDFGYGVKSFSSFLFYPAALSLIGIFFVVLREKNESSQDKIDLYSRTFRRSLWLSSLILLSAILPYLLVGKSTSLFWLDFYSGRHSFPLVAPLALMLAVIGNFITSAVNARLGMKFFSVIIVSTLFFNLALFGKDINKKVREERALLTIANSLSPILSLVPSGKVSIVIENSKSINVNVYESLYFWFRISGDVDSSVQISSPELITPKLFLELPDGRQLPRPGLTCRSTIKIYALSATEFNRLSDLSEVNFGSPNLQTKC